MQQEAPTRPASSEFSGHPNAWSRRRQHEERRDAPLVPRLPPTFTEIDKYRWIRANRGSFEILEALNHSDRDADFDAQIEAAMRMSAAGRHYQLPPDLDTQW